MDVLAKGQRLARWFSLGMIASLGGCAGYDYTGGNAAYPQSGFYAPSPGYYVEPDSYGPPVAPTYVPPTYVAPVLSYETGGFVGLFGFGGREDWDRYHHHDWDRGRDWHGGRGIGAPPPAAFSHVPAGASRPGFGAWAPRPGVPVAMAPAVPRAPAPAFHAAPVPAAAAPVPPAPSPGRRWAPH